MSEKPASDVIELTTTPFYPQQKYQCGPAALAMVLNESGVEVTPEQLVKQVYLPGKKGSIQLEMIAATRRSGRLPYQLDRNLEPVMQMLQQGKPVLVFLNLGTRSIPAYHYAVLIGYQPDTDKVILRSGEDRRLLVPRRRFLTSWKKTDYWGMVVLAPGEIPMNVDLKRYLDAVIVLESVGQYEAAEKNYSSALKRQPGNTLARFGLANTLRSQGELDEAVSQYRLVLSYEPVHKPALNNLADTLLRLGRCKEALGLNWPVDMNDSELSAIDRALLRTRREIEQSCVSRRPGS